MKRIVCKLYDHLPLWQNCILYIQLRVVVIRDGD